MPWLSTPRSFYPLVWVAVALSILATMNLLDSRIARAEAGPFRDYAATKRELADSVARLAREWAPRTRVNGVAPGPVLAPEGVREAAGDFPLGRRPAPEDVARVRERVEREMKLDPEIPADIYELGLIYRIDIDDDRLVTIDMTLTAPGCPVAGEMPGWVENAVGAVEGVSGVEVRMTFDPPWTPDRMSEEAQVAVGWY